MQKKPQKRARAHNAPTVPTQVSSPNRGPIHPSPANYPVAIPLSRADKPVPIPPSPADNPVPILPSRADKPVAIPPSPADNPVPIPPSRADKPVPILPSRADKPVVTFRGSTHKKLPVTSSAETNFGRSWFVSPVSACTRTPTDSDGI